MDAKSEIQKTKAMITKAGFKVIDLQFDGVIAAQDQRVVAVINKMAEEQMAMGVVRVYYDVGGDVRAIEIPVGKPPPGAEAPPQQ